MLFIYHLFSLVHSESRYGEPALKRNKNGREQLLYNGHAFNRHVVRNNITYWRCAQFNALRCRARCKTKGDQTDLLNERHNHDIIRAPRKYGALKELQRQKQLIASLE